MMLAATAMRPALARAVPSIPGAAAAISRSCAIASASSGFSVVTRPAIARRFTSRGTSAGRTTIRLVPRVAIVCATSRPAPAPSAPAATIDPTPTPMVASTSAARAGLAPNARTDSRRLRVGLIAARRRAARIEPAVALR